MNDFFLSLVNVVCEMAPYLLLGFFIAGVLHVFVPQNFYRRYLSRDKSCLCSGLPCWVFPSHSVRAA